jgi:hypothetical protein
MTIKLKTGEIAELFEENGKVTVNINGVDKFVLNVSSIYEAGYSKDQFRKMINELLDLEI